jgi:hypothetical protein
MTKLILVLLLVSGVTAAVPMGAQQDHGHHMNARGKQGMGFDQEKTTHHFLLDPDGGRIDVTVKDWADRDNLTAIRTHLPHIAQMFGNGNFDIPHFVHDRTVPGTADMAKMKTQIRYRYEEISNGGRVRISTSDAAALAAVHAFLRFQIQDHRTGDPLEVRGRP